MDTQQRDELFKLVMRYHDGELPEEERQRVRAKIEQDAEASAWLADMEAMGDATFEFVRDAVKHEDFSEYWVTIDEGVRSPTAGLRRRKRERDEAGLVPWLRRRLGTWLLPASGMALAGAAAAVVLIVGLPWASHRAGRGFSAADWAGIDVVDNTLEIEDITGDAWSVSILAAGEDQPMIIWLDDLHAEEGPG